MLDLGYVMRRAWELCRSQPVLWVLGFLASLGTIGVRLGAGNRVAWDQMVGRVAPEVRRRVHDLFGLGAQATVPAALGLVVLVGSFG
jgi:hypothetical protein